MEVNQLSKELTRQQFETISQMVKKVAGINLHDGKMELVKSRLNKRLRALKLGGFDEYIQYLKNDTSATELIEMLDAISTNLTSFFRESSHFDFLVSSVLPDIVKKNNSSSRKRLRCWSAGCSSGEEPYTIAMCLSEAISDINNWDAKILATDLCTKVLADAQNGRYLREKIGNVPNSLLKKYFQQAGANEYHASAQLKKMITFARLNLMEAWPMKGPFDFIFCRNVMIYFDKATQAKLVDRYWELLDKGGVLFIGHSESLTGVDHRFKYVQPTVYQKA